MVTIVSEKPTPSIFRVEKQAEVGENGKEMDDGTETQVEPLSSSALDLFFCPDDRGSRCL
jgi:hypothetical protein